MICQLCSKVCKKIARDFSRCSACYAVFYENAKPTNYEADYFEKEYQKQYGSSYVDDKSNIMKRSLLRLSHFNKFRQTNIKKIHADVSSSVQQETLLEIGSAAGFFLEAASKQGYQVKGWEISQTMAEYANNTGFDTSNGDFFSLFQKWSQQQQSQFNIVAAFYVIEHFSNQEKLWSALSSLVQPNGFLLLALPSTFGPMFYLHFNQWQQTHATDHFIDYSPLSLEQVSSKHGFSLKSYRAEGIHPERIMNNQVLQKPLAWLQQMFGFSDTFFAILERHPQ